MLILELSLSSFLTASDQGSLTTIGELLNISTLDPLLPTLLITTPCLCVLLTILYYSLVIAWEVFWASQQSPLEPSAEVILTLGITSGTLNARSFCSNSSVRVEMEFQITDEQGDKLIGVLSNRDNAWLFNNN